MIKDFFIGLIISVITFCLMLTNYKKVKFTKKYKVILFVLGVTLFFVSTILKSTFLSETIISTIGLGIITPIEIGIFTYFGVCIVKKREDKSNEIK